MPKNAEWPGGTGRKACNGSIVRIALVAALAVALGASALAQIIASSIVGEVTDASGGTVPDAKATVTNTGTGVVSQTMAGASGAYFAPNLQPGVCEVAVTKAGFQT